MVFKIRIVLDLKEDVIRTIAIDANSTLEELHNTIAHVFGFNGQQMASFYRTDDEWTQGEEIPLISMDESPKALCMSNTTIDQNIESVGEKMIYVYDFLEMWTFFVELIAVVEKSDDALPKLVLSIGDVPEKAPEKEFKASRDTFEDDAYGAEEGFGDMENLDDIDFDRY